MMRRLIVKTIVVATLAVPFLFADHPGNPGTPPTPAQTVARQVARLTVLLGLSTQQQADATTIFTTEQTTLAGLVTGREAAETALQAAIESNNAAGISSAATQIGNLTAQQVLAEATADAAFYAKLTSAQQTTFNNMKVGGLDGRGPGAGGGPPHH